MRRAHFGFATSRPHPRAWCRAWIFTAALALGSGALAQELVVFAASSLTNAFAAVAAAFEAGQPGTEVLLSFGGSSTLALQIMEGAPADVFASADFDQMQRVVDADLALDRPNRFAGNRLVVIATVGSGITTLADLAADGVTLVLGAPAVPVGAYSREALARLEHVYGDAFAARVLANLVSEESNVRQAAARVILGEVDAAIVYETDAVGLAGVRVIDIPDFANATATYAIVPLARSHLPDLADAFVAFVLSERGRAILDAHGFERIE